MSCANWIPKKASLESDIPVKIIKENLDIVSNFVYNNFNNSLLSSNFPSNLKNATKTPIFKNKGRSNFENYRPSIESMWKVYVHSSLWIPEQNVFKMTMRLSPRL